MVHERPKPEELESGCMDEDSLLFLASCRCCFDFVFPLSFISAPVPIDELVSCVKWGAPCLFCDSINGASHDHDDVGNENKQWLLLVVVMTIWLYIVQDNDYERNHQESTFQLYCQAKNPLSDDAFNQTVDGRTAIRNGNC